MYNFFEESSNVNLWRHLTDTQTHPLEDLKYAPLIYEVSPVVVPGGLD